MRSQLALLLFLVAGSASAQERTIEFRIKSEHLDQERSIWISLPKYYAENKYQCHTLYLLDADQIQSSQTIKSIRNQLFENGGYIQPLIIVGITQINRSRELSPYGKTGAKFLRYINEEVIPLIDSTFNTIPDRIIAGHSLGGYFALHTWMASIKMRPLRKVENYTDLLNFSNLVNLNSLIIKRIKFIKSLRFSKLGFSEWPQNLIRALLLVLLFIIRRTGSLLIWAII